MNQPQMGQPLPQQNRPAVAPWLWIVLIIVLLAGIGYIGWYYYNKNKTATTATTTPATTDVTADWQTYANTTFGYSIKYPKTWAYVQSKVAGVATDSSIVFSESSVTQTTINAVAKAKYTGVTLDQFTTEYVTPKDKSTISGKTTTKIGTQNGYQELVTITDPASSGLWYFTENTENFYVFVTTEKTQSTNIKNMLSTFKFTTATTATTPEKVAENFYTFYLDLVNPSGQANSQAKFQSTTKPYKLKSSFSTYMTATLISTLEGLFNNSSKNSDPIICAQDIPTKITYDTATITGDKATSVANLQFATVEKVTLAYTKENGSWKISAITCP